MRISPFSAGSMENEECPSISKRGMQWTGYIRREGKEIGNVRLKSVCKTAVWELQQEAKGESKKKVKWAFPIWGNRKDLFITVLSSMAIKSSNESLRCIYNADFIISTSKHSIYNMNPYKSTATIFRCGRFVRQSTCRFIIGFCRPKERESKCQMRQMDSSNPKWWTPRLCKQESPCRWSTEQATLRHNRQRLFRCYSLSMGIGVHKTLQSNQCCYLHLCT